MNSKIAILATALGLALASNVDAQTVIRFSGSTAFRSAVNTQILGMLSSTGRSVIFTSTNPTAPSLGNASRATYSGNFGTVPVVIEVLWSGSGAGIQDVAQNLDESFLSPTNPGGTSTGFQITGTPILETGKVDAGFSDVYQASTPFTSPKLIDNKVCVVPFRWIVNKNAPAGLTNMTPGLVQNLFQAQTLPLSIFTGNSTDRTNGTLVYGLGRDPDSGTRITMTAESGLGAFAFLSQSIVDITTGQIKNPQPYSDTADGSGANDLHFGVGNNGYHSGGDLANALLLASADSNVYVGYLGTSDALTATHNDDGTAGRGLTWNGVAYSPTAVYEGQYSFWGYEHLFYTTATSGNTAKMPFITALKNNVATTPGGAGLVLGNMKVNRPSDGAPIGN